MVLGDLTWLTLALPGLDSLSGRFAAGFVVLKIAGGLHLIFLGLRACFAPATRRDTPPTPVLFGFRSLSAGLVEPQGDFVFYLAVLPVVVELTRVMVADGQTIAAIGRAG